jgi:hypothetical protein
VRLRRRPRQHEGLKLRCIHQETSKPSDSTFALTGHNDHPRIAESQTKEPGHLQTERKDSGRTTVYGGWVAWCEAVAGLIVCWTVDAGRLICRSTRHESRPR